MSTLAAVALGRPLVLAGILQLVCLLTSVSTGFHAWREVTAILAIFVPVIPRNLTVVAVIALTTGHLYFHKNQGSPAEAAVRLALDGAAIHIPPTPARLEMIRPFGRAWTSTATLLQPAPIDAGRTIFQLPRGTLIAIQGHTSPPEPWSTLLLSGSAGLPETSRNPGEWNPRAQLREKGVRIELHLNRLLPQPVAVEPPLWIRLNTALSNTIQPTHSVDDEPLQLIRSSLLGASGDALSAIISDFRATGTLHLFAVSGMNIAVLAAIVRLLVRPLGSLHVGGLFIAALAITLYAVATGLAPSCQRALVMALLPLLATQLNRPITLLNTLAASFVLLALIDPNMVFQTGFQLSVALVLGLATLTPCVTTLLEPDAKRQIIPETLLPFKAKARRASHKLMATFVAVSLTATITSLPWSVLAFRQVALHAPLVNLAAVPIANLQMVGAFIAILFAPFPNLSRRITDLNIHNARLLAAIVRCGARIPGTLLIPTPETRGADFVLLDEPGACVSLLGPPRHATLVNTGSENHFRSSVSRAVQSYGCNALDSVILTTGDSAHLGGAVALLEKTPPKGWMMPATTDRSTHHRHLREWMEARQISKRFLLAPTTFVLGDESTLQCLHPRAHFNATNAADNSAVLRWNTRGTRILFTGPAGFSTEHLLANLDSESVQADIWFKGLHPKDISGTATLFERIRPKVVVLNRNPYRASDPSVAALRALCRAKGTPLLEMENTGAIIGRIKETEIQLTPYLEPSRPLVIPINAQRFGKK